jgi:hypothetical protein
MTFNSLMCNGIILLLASTTMCINCLECIMSFTYFLVGQHIIFVLFLSHLVNIFLYRAELLSCIGFICLICNLKTVVSGMGSIFSEMLTTFFFFFFSFFFFFLFLPFFYSIGIIKTQTYNPLYSFLSYDPKQGHACSERMNILNLGQQVKENFNVN